MNKLGVSDVEEWLKLTDKDGVDIYITETERSHYLDFLFHRMVRSVMTSSS